MREVVQVVRVRDNCFPTFSQCQANARLRLGTRYTYLLIDRWQSGLSTRHDTFPCLLESSVTPHGARPSPVTTHHHQPPVTTAYIMDGHHRIGNSKRSVNSQHSTQRSRSWVWTHHPSAWTRKVIWECFHINPDWRVENQKSLLNDRGLFLVFEMGAI